MIDFTKFYKFELSLGNRCNFRCKYCFEPHPETSISKSDVTVDQLLRYAEFIKYMKDRRDPSWMYSVSAFGGETLLYLDPLYEFAKASKNDISELTITSNGTLVKSKTSSLLNFKKLLGPAFTIIISYDFCHQNQYRQANTYDSVRDSLRLLSGRKFSTICITVFDGETLPLAWERFQDFLQLLEEIPTLQVKFNLSRNVGAFDNMNEDKAREALSKIQEYLTKYPELQNRFYYNPSFMYRNERLEDAFFGNVLLGMTLNGDIYPGYDVPFTNDFTRAALYIGNIADDFEKLHNKRSELLNTLHLDPPEKCIKCGSVCRVLPWARMNSSLSEYNMIPDEQHCYIHKLVSEYIPYKRKH